MNSVLIAGSIAGRFLRQQLRNPSAVAMLILVPLLVGGVLGFADQRANTALPVGMLEYEPGPFADGLAEAISDGEALRVHEYASLASLEKAVRRGDVVAGVLISDTYDDQVAAGAPAAVRVIGDPEQSTFRAANGDIFLIVARENGLLINARNNIAASGRPLTEELNALRELPTPTEVTSMTAASGSHAFGFGRFTAGMLVFFIFDAAMFHAAVFRDDRRRGVIARMSTTPNRSSVIAAGEVAGRAVLSVAQGLVIVFAGALLFGLRWGDPLGVVAVIVLFALVATGAGLLVGVAGKASTVAETEMMTAGLIAVLGLLGGCFWPLALVPDWLRNVSHISPHAWANDAFDQLLATKAGVAQLWLELSVLAGLATVLFMIAVRFLRRVPRS